MKQLFVALVSLSVSLSTVGFAQAAPATAARLPKTTGNPGYVVVGADANSRLLEATSHVTGPSGEVIPVVNRYVELATGLNYQESDGSWAESKDEIESFPGGAAAQHGQYQVIFGNDLNTADAIDVRLPDGKRMRSHVLALSYEDPASGRSVIVAEIKSSRGQLLPPNVVLYPDAFDGIKADVRYTYTRAGLEQDIILREKPPGPEAYGLNPATAKLQVLTEFVDRHQPKKSAIQSDSGAGEETDEVLDFGSMQMRQGKAFSLEPGGKDVPVHKRWLTVQNRNILVEELAISDLKSDLEALPSAAGASLKPVKDSIASSLPGKHIPSSGPSVRADTNAMQLVALSQSPHGVVLDYYQALSAGQTNYTFQGDTTYYISGAINLYQTTTFEGGAVIKFASTNQASLVINYPAQVNCQGTLYRPTVFTSMNDNTEGTAIPGSTGTPGSSYGPAISYTGGSGVVSTMSLHHFRIVSASPAISCSGQSININLTDGQIVNCAIGLSSTGFGSWNLENMLFSKFTVGMAMSYANVQAQHVTFDGNVYTPTNGPSMLLVPTIQQRTAYLNLLNCILANVTMITNGYPGIVTADHTGFFNDGFDGQFTFGTSIFQVQTSPFRRLAAAYYYLTDASGFRGQGSPNIDPALVQDLRNRTTYPPSTSPPYQYNVSRIWAPVVQRDTGPNFDLGYHYDPIDYLCSQMSAQGIVTLTNGVAVGFWGSSGFNGGPPVISTGLPIAFNHLFFYPSVQEQPINFFGTSTAGSSLFTSVCPSTTFTFTDIAMLGNRQMFASAYFSYQFPGFALYDCQLHGVNVTAGGQCLTSGQPCPWATLQNCLLDRCNATFFNGYSTYYTGSGVIYYQQPMAVTLYNNLFWQCNVTMTYLGLQEQWGISWNFKDNLFYNTPFSFSSDANYLGTYINASNNGYWLTTDALPAPNDVTLTGLSLAPGPLGPFYIGSSSPDISDLGSRSVSAAGLDNFTIVPSQVPDTGTVAIGYHYPVIPQPTADPVNGSTCPSQPLSITLSGSSPNTPYLYYNLATLPAHGRLTGVAPNFIYTPTPPYEGPDSFSYTVSDGILSSAAATVSITVGNAVSAADNYFQSLQNTPFSFVLNVYGYCGEDPSTFTYSLQTPPSNGQLSGSYPNLTYTPNSPTFTGSDSFTYMVSNGTGSSSMATVHINILPPSTYYTSTGTDFWIPWADMFDNYPYALRLIITGAASTTGAVYGNGLGVRPGPGLSQTFTVTPGVATIVSLDQNYWDDSFDSLFNYGNYLASAQILDSGSVQPKGIHIVSAQPVSVAVDHDTPYLKATWLCFPTTMLGTNYYVMSRSPLSINDGYMGYQEGSQSEFAIVATLNNTHVTINAATNANLVTNVMWNSSVTAGPATNPFTVTMQAGDTLQLWSDRIYDSTGTHILSDKPIGVLSGDYDAYVPATNDIFADNSLMQQLLPVESWGREYFGFPFASRGSGDTYRVVAGFSNTIVRFNGVAVATLDPGGYYDVTTNSLLAITASQPVEVAQFSSGLAFDDPSQDRDGDPTMMLLTPAGRFVGNCTLPSVVDPNTTAWTPSSSPAPVNYLNLVVDPSAINSTYVTLYGQAPGAPVSGFRPIAGSGFFGAQVPITNPNGLPVVINSPKPFAVQSYGFAFFDAYGLMGGLNTAPVVAVGDAFNCGAAGATIDVLTNDIYANRNDITVTITTPPTLGHANVNVGPNTITYTPNNGSAVATDSFVYQMTENGVSSTATVTVWINNHNPVANPVSANASGSNPATVNIVSYDTDPDGNSLTILGVGSPNNGTVWLNSPGQTVTYICTNSAVSDSFNYTVTDSHGGMATGVVTVTIQH